MPIKAVVFDCFGVIYDSPLNAFLDKLDQQARDSVVELFHDYDKDKIETAKILTKIAEISDESVYQINNQLFGGFRINPIISTYIQDLKKYYKTGLLTNVGSGVFLKIERSLEPLFDAQVVSYKVRLAKPEKAIYELMANRLGLLPRECVFVDDQQKHCIGAQNAGMKSILYENAQQLKRDLATLLDANN